MIQENMINRLIGGCVIGLGLALNSFNVPQANFSSHSNQELSASFARSWRKLGLDDIGEGAERKPAKDFVQPLPIRQLSRACHGMELYWFDFNRYQVRGTQNQVIDMAPGFTGSAGTRAILFGLDPQTKTFKVLFDENVIELLGQGSKTCPKISLRVSGSHFYDKRPNGQYGIAEISYDVKKGIYGYDKKPSVENK